MRKILISCLFVFGFALFLNAQDHSHDHHNHDHHNHDHHDHNHDHAHKDDHSSHGGCGHHEVDPATWDPAPTAFHHISDANVFSIGPFSIPLPCILYAPDHGLSMFMSSKFDFDWNAHEGTGHKAIDRYVLDLGVVRRIKDNSFPMGEIKIDGITHKKENDVTVGYVCYGGNKYQIEDQSTIDGGVFGGGMTSFYDFSISKNVISMFLMVLFLFWLFRSVANTYKKRRGMAPTGKQSLVEAIFVFIQDEVAKPFLGHKWEKFTPFLMALFFFILALNLFGQIPFLGGSNATGNLALTLVLAVITFFVVNLNGNKHYWQHIFNFPDVPAPVKAILTPIEILGVFIKPLTLMLRLFANITAGHIVIIIFISLIFMFSEFGRNMGIGVGAAAGSVFLTLFMMAIELLVAFIQAFVFTILTASYIGAATEEAHH